MAITKTDPAESRATRLTQGTIPGEALTTHWNIVQVLDGSFTTVTSAVASTSPNVLDSDLDFIDIWLPPSHTYTVRTRHGTASGSLTAWTGFEEFTSRGPLNSFEKYQALSGLGGVDNIDT